MTSDSIEELRALTGVVSFFYAYPDLVRAEGVRVWSEYQRRAQLHAEVWPLQVGLRLLALDQAKRAVLDPSYEVSEDVLSRPDWEHLLGMAQVRHAECNDLRTVPEAELYKEHVLANLPEDSSLFGGRAMSREEVEGLLVAPVEFDGYRHEPYEPADFLTGALYAEMRGHERSRTVSEWCRAAVLLLVTRALEVPCVDLGLEAELPADGVGSRTDIRTRAENRLPDTGSGQASGGQLVLLTSARLEHIAVTLERQKSAPQKHEPRSEASSSKSLTEQEFFIPLVIPKRARGRGGRRQTLPEGWAHMSDLVRAAQGISRSALYRYWHRVPAIDRDHDALSGEQTVRVEALGSYAKQLRSTAT